MAAAAEMEYGGGVGGRHRDGGWRRSWRPRRRIAAVEGMATTAEIQVHTYCQRHCDSDFQIAAGDGYLTGKYEQRFKYRYALPTLVLKFGLSSCLRTFLSLNFLFKKTNLGSCLSQS